LIARLPDVAAAYLLVDSSPKFLRLALEKLRAEERVAFRLIRYLREEARLQMLDEVVPKSMIGTFDVVTSTNAIHLYYGLEDTLRSWGRALKSGGHAFVQSGNIRNPEARPGSWIIDETVEHVHTAALAIVQSDDRYARFASLGDAARMAAHDDVRRKFFLPVRPLSHYVEAFERSGFEVVSVEARPITARVDEWNDFLAAYHEGVLGWAGGTRRVDGRDPDDDTVALRLSLLRDALRRVFDDKPEFTASWTYLTCRKP
jgi:SAM-dependent methyltransferase